MTYDSDRMLVVANCDIMFRKCKKITPHKRLKEDKLVEEPKTTTDNLIGQRATATPVVVG